jgi:hypothetical protein
MGRHGDCIVPGRVFLWEGDYMRRFGLLSALGLVLSFVLGLGWSQPAHALQFTPGGGERLHTIASGQPGAQWNTGGTGSGGQLSYNAGTGVATLTAVLDVLNYFDPGNGACATDVGSNCPVNFATDLTVTLDAAFVGIDVTPIGGPLVNITLNFETTANALPDLVVSDSTDVGFGNVLEGDWTSGFFNGNATTGLAVSVLFNTSTGTASFSSANVSGFLAIDSGTAYASLFESGSNYLGLNIGTLGDFVGAGGDLDDIVAATYLSGTLPSFTAEANGQVYRLTSDDFVVPEPTTALLLAGGLALLGARRTRS